MSVHKNFKEMTWDAVLLFVMPSVGGMIMVIASLIHRDNPKLGGDPNLLLAIGIALVFTGPLWFFQYLFSKEEGKYNIPTTHQQQKDHELTATH